MMGEGQAQGPMKNQTGRVIISPGPFLFRI
jgi:hypothetical protein